VRKLLLVQPLHEARFAQRQVRAPGVEVQRRAVRGERVGKARREAGDERRSAGRHHGQRARHRVRTQGLRFAPAQALDEQRAHAPQQPRVPVDQALEGRRWQSREQRIAHRVHGGRARLGRQHRHFAERLAGADLVQHALDRAVVDRAQAAAQHDVRGVARIAAPEQELAAAQRDPAGFRFELGKRRAIGRPEQPRQVRGELRTPELLPVGLLRAHARIIRRREPQARRYLAECPASLTSTFSLASSEA
jgi:hypothetical protein